MHLRLMIGSTGIAVLAACGTAPPALPPSSAESVVRAIAARFSACEMDALLAHYAPDAEFASPNTKTPISGHAALREYFSGACNGAVRPVMRLVHQNIQPLAPGALLVTGVYTFGRTDKPTDEPWSGSFVITLVQSAGQWVIRSQATFETPH